MKRQKDCFTLIRKWKMLCTRALKTLMILPLATFANNAAHFDASTFISDFDMDDPVRIAVTGDVIIEGKVGDDLTGINMAVVTLTGDTFSEDTFIDGDARSWFTSGRPDGIDVTAFKIDAVTVHLYFSGLPTETSNAAFNIVIPAHLLTDNMPVTVMTNPNAKFEIGENITVEPIKSAVVSDLIVEGKVGDDLQGTYSTVITLTGDTFTDGFINGNAETWFPSGLPAGIDGAVFKIDDVTARFYFSGMPTEVSNDVFDIVIPGHLLTGNTPVPVETNPNAKFDIGENVTFDPIRTADVSDVIVGGKVGDDLIGTYSTAITLTGDTFVDGFISGNAESWFVPCLPAGIDVAVFKFDDVTARLYFSGLPTDTSNDVFNLEIPANLLTSNTPLVVETNPNAKFAIDENSMFNPVKSAVIWDVTVSGKVDETLPYYAVIIKLTGDAFKEDEFSSGVDASTWFISGSPAGIEIMAYRTDNETIRINFSGLPTEASNDVFNIEIPAHLLTGNESVSIETNPNAKFDIGERDTDPGNEDQVGDDPGDNNPGGNNPQSDNHEDNNPDGNNPQSDNHEDNNPDGNNSQGDNPVDNNQGDNKPGDHDPNDLSVNNEHLSTKSLKAYAQNGILHVSGLRQGVTLHVYNILGSLIYQGKTYEDKVSIPLPGRGVFIVTDGAHGVKVSN